MLTFRNTGQLQRGLRLLLGVALLAWGWWAPSHAASAPLRVLALYPLLTGLVGWCPIVALVRLFRRRD